MSAPSLIDQIGAAFAEAPDLAARVDSFGDAPGGPAFHPNTAICFTTMPSGPAQSGSPPSRVMWGHPPRSQHCPSVMALNEDQRIISRYFPGLLADTKKTLSPYVAKVRKK